MVHPETMGVFHIAYSFCRTGRLWADNALPRGSALAMTTNVTFWANADYVYLSIVYIEKKRTEDEEEDFLKKKVVVEIYFSVLSS